MRKSEERGLFFKQLAEKAKLANCFIYNPYKVISMNTNRLEVGEPIPTHTGWGLNEHQVWLEFYCVDKSKNAIHSAENRERFQKLFAHKTEIERTFGECLTWDFDPTRIKQSIISKTATPATLENRIYWDKIQDDLIDRTSRLGAALKPFLTHL